MSNRNKQAGGRWELDVIKDLKEMGYEAVSSRSESRNAEARGIDIITNFPYNIQCKASVNNPNYHKLLTETDAGLIFHRKMEKRKTQFYTIGEYVNMPKASFYKLINNGNTKNLQR